MELRTALTWREDVEVALERLLGSMTPERVLLRAQPGRGRAARPRATARWGAHCVAVTTQRRNSAIASGSPVDNDRGSLVTRTPGSTPAEQGSQQDR